MWSSETNSTKVMYQDCMCTNFALVLISIDRCHYGEVITLVKQIDPIYLDYYAIFSTAASLLLMTFLQQFTGKLPKVGQKIREYLEQY